MTILNIVVFDLTRPATFEAVTKWRDDVNSKVILANDQPIPLVLLANKVFEHQTGWLTHNNSAILKTLTSPRKTLTSSVAKTAF